MKAITDTLGVARSNVAERVKATRPKRGPQSRDGDLELAAEIRALVDQRPTYGYRRIAALIKRERRSGGGTPVNAKRVYRLMKKHGLLLARHTGRRRPRAMTDASSRYDPTSAGVLTAWSSPAGTTRSFGLPSRSTATTGRSSAGSQRPRASPAR